MSTTIWSKGCPPVVAGLKPTPANVADRLSEFMAERHRMYLCHRARLPWPWTVDPILHGYRFCNVYRECDTVTQWIDANIRRPFANDPNLWFMLANARMINWPDTLQELMEHDGAWPVGDYWSADAMVDCLRQRDARGAKIFTGAYIVSNGGCSTPKIELVSKDYLGGLWHNRVRMQEAIEGCDTLQGAHGVLRAADGWGAFLSYEVVCDMRFTRYLRHAADISTWGDAGPGARRGLDRLWGRGWKGRNSSLSQWKALREMRDLLEHIELLWPGPWPVLEMREIEHSLCEYDKWCRAWQNEGKPRAKYHGPAHSIERRVLHPVSDQHPLLQ